VLLGVAVLGEDDHAAVGPLQCCALALGAADRHPWALVDVNPIEKVAHLGAGRARVLGGQVAHFVEQLARSALRRCEQTACRLDRGSALALHAVVDSQCLCILPRPTSSTRNSKLWGTATRRLGRCLARQHRVASGHFGLHATARGLGFWGISTRRESPFQRRGPVASAGDSSKGTPLATRSGRPTAREAWTIRLADGLVSPDDLGRPLLHTLLCRAQVTVRTRACDRASPRLRGTPWKTSCQDLLGTTNWAP
jgi:hypothetical protein